MSRAVERGRARGAVSRRMVAAVSRVRRRSNEAVTARRRPMVIVGPARGDADAQREGDGEEEAQEEIDGFSRHLPEQLDGHSVMAEMERHQREGDNSFRSYMKE